MPPVNVPFKPAPTTGNVGQRFFVLQSVNKPVKPPVLPVKGIQNQFFGGGGGGSGFSGGTITGEVPQRLLTQPPIPTPTQEELINLGLLSAAGVGLAVGAGPAVVAGVGAGVFSNFIAEEAIQAASGAVFNALVSKNPAAIQRAIAQDEATLSAAEQWINGPGRAALIFHPGYVEIVNSYRNQLGAFKARFEAMQTDEVTKGQRAQLKLDNALDRSWLVQLTYYLQRGQRDFAEQVLQRIKNPAIANAGAVKLQFDQLRIEKRAAAQVRREQLFQDIINRRLAKAADRETRRQQRDDAAGKRRQARDERRAARELVLVQARKVREARKRAREEKAVELAVERDRQRNQRTRQAETLERLRLQGRKDIDTLKFGEAVKQFEVRFGRGV